MWQTDWAERPRQTRQQRRCHRTPRWRPRPFSSTYLLLWNEHCIECAVPDCYALCSLYVARRDRKCARFKYGIAPNPKYPGLFPFGAEIEFRRWGKLESTFGFGLGEAMASPMVGPDRPRDPAVHSPSLFPVARDEPVPQTEWRLRSFPGAGAASNLTGNRREDFDEFVIEVWNLQSQPVRLVIECWQQGPKFRSSILLEPGRTVQTNSGRFDEHRSCTGSSGMIRVYPDHDAEAHLVFSWLDFVRYRQDPGVATAPDNRTGGAFPFRRRTRRAK